MILTLSPDNVDRLVRLLDVAKAVRPGENVSAMLEPDPWGELKHFGREIYDPLEALTNGPSVDGPHHTVTLTEVDASTLFDIIYCLSVSWSTGRYWDSPLDTQDLAVVDLVQTQLGPRPSARRDRTTQ